MKIEIQDLPIDQTLRGRVTRQMAKLLARLQAKPVAAQVRFFDENGPKGGVAIRCALMVQLPYRSAIRVEHTAETPRLAFDGSFQMLEREFVRYRARERESRRRPKKYFIAKRLLTSGGEPAESE